ncbi:MAG: class I SAM-dependent methyltransferase [Acidobacteria bacterium]|nr:MAG: class I SAM-dependent methyltransferase [Acidobacteriota bacterium]
MIVGANDLNRIRIWELEAILNEFPARADVLEIGAGTGVQARYLQEHGYSVQAVDRRESGYRNYAHYARNRVFPVQEYEGEHLPVADASADVVYTSHCLMYVRNLGSLSGEMRRVLRPGGYAVHVVPTVSWRFWTSLASFPMAAMALARAVAWSTWRPPRNHTRRGAWRDALAAGYAALIQPPLALGPHAGFELWRFRRGRWRRSFGENGFTVIRDRPVGMFGTGCLLFGSALPAPKRQWLAKLLGSSSRVYCVRPQSGSGR